MAVEWLPAVKGVTNALNVLVNVVVRIGTAWNERVDDAALLDIAGLRFSENGTKAIVKKVAQGKATQNDLAQLKARLSGTALKTHEILQKLDFHQPYGSLILRKSGFKTAAAFKDSIQSLRVDINRRLNELVDRKPNDEESAREAQAVAEAIVIFNEKLETLHEKTFPPKRQTTRVTATKPKETKPKETKPRKGTRGR
jgi:hypothetical protein